ncbi:MAG: sigma-70 family RNA polymerase sigma factor [Planctomycetes bacterium]|nr:sigma-70 family RNA polymerase sigma factor [Planctomycetota bacterium]
MDARKPSETMELLQRWHSGDRDALGKLLERDLPWIREQVGRRLGAALRARAETGDFVQDAVLQILRYGPRFLLSDRDQFRALIARIVENQVRMRHRYLHQEKRDVGREQPIPGSDTVLNLDSSQTAPSQAAMRNEASSWLQLGIELLPAEDREIVHLRQWQGLAFEDIGRQLGIREDAARMRFQRALGRLARLVQRIRNGELATILNET